MGISEEPKALEESGYFCLSHNRSSIGSEKRNLRSYIAKFKHALLFNKKIALADHMIVNTPNFRIAYHEDSTFRDLINREFVDLVFIERKSDGSFPKLEELRNFYMRAEKSEGGGGPLHRSLPWQFRDDKLDSELAKVQSECRKYFPSNSTKRDEYFTATCEDLIKSNYIDVVMGELAGVYRRAHEKLLISNPKLGIIHFDIDHKFDGEDNIFDHMAKLPAMRGDRYSAALLEKRFGKEISHIYRSALIQSETKIMECHAVLPKELAEYSGIILDTSPTKPVEVVDTIAREIPVNMDSLNENIFFELSINEIAKLRMSDEGTAYFFALKNLDATDASFVVLCDTVKEYTGRISAFLEEKYTGRLITSNADMIRLTKNIFADDNYREVGVTVVVNAIASAVAYETTNVWTRSIIFGAAISGLTKIPSKPISNIIKDVLHPTDQSVRSAILLEKKRDKLDSKSMIIQYRS